MTIHYPGPYEIRLFYTITGGTGVIQHEARYNCVSPAIQIQARHLRTLMRCDETTAHLRSTVRLTTGLR